MGMNPTLFNLDVTLPEIGKQIGNAMSLNVIERVLRRLLVSAGLAPNIGEDRWENGQAVKELEKSRDQDFIFVGERHGEHSTSLRAK